MPGLWERFNDVPGGDGLAYYLGPAAKPVSALAQFIPQMLPSADMVDMQAQSANLMRSRSPGEAGKAGLGLLAATMGMAIPGTAKGITEGVEQATKGIRAYHTTQTPFDEFDWGRLGSATAENAGGMSHEEWASNLAKIGPWASEKNLGNAVGPHTLPVEIGGKGKSFASLDKLEAAVRRAGGPEQFRAKMVDGGFGHLSVADEEFGGKSFIALSPANFTVKK